MGKSIKKLVKFGVDIEEAMTRFVGDEKTYLDCIEILINDNKFYELGDAINKDEYDRSYQLAISLKGIIGNLSIEPMYEKISAIVGLLSIFDYADIKAEYKKLMELFESLKKIK